MKRVVVIVLVAAALLAMAVAALAPASLIAPSLERATGGRVVAGEVEGSLWHGRAVLAAGAARLPVAWKLDPVPLLSGEARVRLTPVDGSSNTVRADISARPSTWVASARTSQPGHAVGNAHCSAVNAARASCTRTYSVAASRVTVSRHN